MEHSFRKGWLLLYSLNRYLLSAEINNDTWWRKQISPDVWEISDMLFFLKIIEGRMLAWITYNSTKGRECWGRTRCTSVTGLSKGVCIFLVNPRLCQTWNILNTSHLKGCGVITNKRARSLPPGLEVHSERTMSHHGNLKCIICHSIFQINCAYSYIYYTV